MSNIITLTSEDTFFIGGKQVPPGAVLIGDVVKVHKLAGEFKILSKYLEKKKLHFEVERLPEIFFKVRYRFPPSKGVMRAKEVYGVEAMCEAGYGEEGWEPSVFLIKDRGKYRWVPQLECEHIGKLRGDPRDGRRCVHEGETTEPSRGWAS